MRFTFTRRPSTTPTGLIFPIRHRLIAFAVGNCFLYSWYNHPIWIIKETMLKAVAYLSYAWVVQLHRRGLNLRNLDREFLQFFVAGVRPTWNSTFFFTSLGNTFNYGLAVLLRCFYVTFFLSAVKLLCVPVFPSTVESWTNFEAFCN